MVAIKVKSSDITKTELSKEEAIRLMGEDIAEQFDKHENRCIKGEVKLRLRFKNYEPLEDTLQLIVFIGKELTEDQPEDQPKEVINSHVDKMLLKELENKLSAPHPSYGKILSYKVVK